MSGGGWIGESCNLPPPKATVGLRQVLIRQAAPVLSTERRVREESGGVFKGCEEPRTGWVGEERGVRQWGPKLGGPLLTLARGSGPSDLGRKSHVTAEISSLVGSSAARSV